MMKVRVLESNGKVVGILVTGKLLSAKKIRVFIENTKKAKRNKKRKVLRGTK